ncbi:MAG: hypothetical protein ACI85I_002698, partial [Arenicella sp.]
RGFWVLELGRFFHFHVISGEWILLTCSTAFS